MDGGKCDPVTTTKVAILQLDVQWGDTAANLHSAFAYMRLLESDVSTVIMPELWSCSHDNDKMAEHADSTNAIVKEMSSWCRQRGVWMLCGTLPWRAPDAHLRNRLHLISDNGSVEATYDKVHLFPRPGEDLLFKRGEDPLLFSMRGVPSSAAVSYDIRFPEYIRSIALAGAMVLYLPAEWPMERLEHWRTLLKARAIENQMFVIGCNRCGTGGGVDFGGHSMAVAPDGEVLVEAGCSEETVIAELDIKHCEFVRKQLPVFMGRAPGMYHPVTSFPPEQPEETL